MAQVCGQSRNRSITRRGFEGETRLDASQVVVQLLMLDSDAFRLPGRAGCVNDVSKILWDGHGRHWFGALASQRFRISIDEDESRSVGGQVSGEPLLADDHSDSGVVNDSLRAV